jgi:hypothetical protein
LCDCKRFSKSVAEISSSAAGDGSKIRGSFASLPPDPANAPGRNARLIEAPLMNARCRRRKFCFWCDWPQSIPFRASENDVAIYEK